jgi:hypothetical protein
VARIEAFGPSYRGPGYKRAGVQPYDIRSLRPKNASSEAATLGAVSPGASGRKTKPLWRPCGGRRPEHPRAREGDSTEGERRY